MGNQYAEQKSGQLAGVVTMTQERKRIAELTAAVVLTLTLPNGGRVANAGGVLTMGVPVESNGTGEELRSLIIYESPLPKIK